MARVVNDLLVNRLYMPLEILESQGAKETAIVGASDVSPYVRRSSVSDKMGLIG